MKDLLDEKKFGLVQIEAVPFGTRFLAFLIDAGIFIGIGLLVFLFSVFTHNPNFFGLVIFAYMLVGSAYYLFEAFTGLTFGKNIMKLQVAMKDGRYASTGRLFSRFLIKFSGVLLPYFLGKFGISTDPLGLIITLIFMMGCFLALTNQRQSLHDILINTSVFYLKDLRAFNRK